ncbi:MULTISPECIES: DNA primase family protein [Flavobacteriaceae]|uniref:DNA primase n=2 Tax=Flavobacteriaceae TaxID=49546 RepID=A0A4Y8ARL1_9FLAO|nr:MULTISPECIES: phage/plasmid primase, P4 family [Flavobacteriaceae]TEW73823.1 DNA primase [Gramella jeungdoensis]GGK37891.1 primase [Lutibacter litoralis]
MDNNKKQVILNCLEQITVEVNLPVAQKTIFNTIKTQSIAVDFLGIVNSNGVKQTKVTKDQYVIITVDQFLKKLKDEGYELIAKNEEIFIYNGAFWEKVEYDTIKKILYVISTKFKVPKFKAKHYSFRDELFRQLKTTIVTPNFSDEKPIRINVLNGTIEVEGQKINMLNFNQDHFLTYQLSFVFDPNAEASKFQKYLDEVLPDKSLQLVLAEFIGSIFIKNGSGIKLEKALILTGGGSNGKSVFFEIINALLGPENICNFSLGSLTDSSGYSRAQIENKLLNFSSEIDRKMNIAIFKQLTSNEPVEARHPYGRAHQIKNYAKLAFNTNSLPKDVESTKAFFRRFIIIPFNIVIKEEDQDKELHTKIINHELSGVFNWVMKGLARVINQKGFTHSISIVEQVKNYETESDTVRVFMEEFEYEKSTDCKYRVKDLYHTYKDFCKDDGYKPLNNKEFCKSLKNMGFYFIRKNYGQAVNVSP